MAWRGKLSVVLTRDSASRQGTSTHSRDGLTIELGPRRNITGRNELEREIPSPGFQLGATGTKPDRLIDDDGNLIGEEILFFCRKGVTQRIDTFAYFLPK